MLGVEILLVERDPVLYPIAESLIERNAIVVKVSDDLSRLPGPILVHQGLGNVPVIKCQNRLDVMGEKLVDQTIIKMLSLLR